jgi:CRP-like cAMP-binding protein
VASGWGGDQLALDKSRSQQLYRIIPAASAVLICNFPSSIAMTSSGNLELSTIAALAGERAPYRVNQGDVIFREGDLGDKLYGVVSGQVQLRWGHDRVEMIGPGSCFGVGALVDPEHRRFGTAEAVSDCELLMMNREEFLFAMQELPMFGLEMVHDLEQRLQRLKEQVA